MPVNPKIFLFTFILNFFLAHLALAEKKWQHPEQIHTSAYNWLAEEIQQITQDYSIELSSLDSSLKLEACSNPLEIELRGDKDISAAGRVNLKVSCTAPSWFVYLSARVSLYAQIVVANADLPRKTRLTPHLLSLKKIDLSGQNDEYFTSFEQVLNMETRNRVRAGAPILSRNLNATAAINKGEQILLLASNNQIHVRIMGEALETGKIGQQIRVRNLQSGRVVKALVIERGKAQVSY